MKKINSDILEKVKDSLVSEQQKDESNINDKQDQEWQTTEGSNGTNSIKTNVGFNSAVFNFSSYLYLIYRLPSNFGLFVGPEYRYQLNNSYEKTADYKHYSRALGITFGVYKSIN